MHRSFRTLIFIVIVLLFFGQAIYPPDQSIRLGKDLRGGATLVYELDIAPGEDAATVQARTIDVLKQRLDPNGLYEISITAQAQNRLEITMPLPDDRVKALRDSFDQAVRAVAAEAVDPMELESMLRASAEERFQRIEEIAGGNADLRARLVACAEAHDRYWSLDRALFLLEDDDTAAPEERAELVAAAFQARRAFAESLQNLRGHAPSEDELRQALARSGEKLTLWDNVANRRVEIPSPREQSMARLRQAYPASVEGIDKAEQAYLAYQRGRKSLDDPSDLIRQIRNAGILSFRITVDARGEGAHPDADELREKLRELGPRRASAPDARWFKINKIESWYDSLQTFRRIFGDPERGIPSDAASYFATMPDGGYVVEEYDGEFWMLAWDLPGYRLTRTDDGAGDWSVASSSPTTDNRGRPAIAFRMDSVGAQLLGRLTGANVGRRMAVLLDDEVYTAPRLNSQISVSGIIEGTFQKAEIDYIVRVLSAGSLQARLSSEPISQSTVGPQLGKENLRKGFRAGMMALVVISIVMLVYYFRFGMVAVSALLCNAIIIVGAMALNKAVLTMPGIAGLILTFGMAVDSNVLIYERVREELNRGAKLKEAVRLGYNKALSSIVDGNVTNLIVCIVLVLPGVSTQEVKGFAITLGIGVLATLFSALVITRTIFSLCLDVGHWRKAKMLPMVVPIIERVLTPKIDWMKLRWAFVGISAVYISLGLYAIAFQGSKMLDTQFRGGTQVILEFRADPETGRRMALTRAEVLDRLNRISDSVMRDDDPTNDAARDLRSAEVLALEPRNDGRGNFVAERFSIKTTITDSDLVQTSLKEAFEDLLDTKPPISFSSDRQVFPITQTELGTNVVGRPLPDAVTRMDVGAYLDGMVFLIEDLSPAPPLEELRTRLEQLRQAEHPETLGRGRQIIPLEMRQNRVVSAAILIRDVKAGYSDPAQRQEWQRVADEEWRITSTALERTSSLSGVEKFSSSIAETFRNRAMVAIFLSLMLILIYIWIRFGNISYSFGAIVCLLHDCLTVLGLLALAEIICDWEPTQGIARALGLMPFRIDLNMIAAMLTIIGYSLNDSIIVYDRIRENRGKVPYATRRVINESINQTLSRTVMTSGTTLLAALFLYTMGGEGVRAFAFALLIGVGIGTYSSIAVAAPLVWSRKHDAYEAELIASLGARPEQPPAP
ncbi:MAG: protein translocase subunit SecD [Phycisphaeraceae bacterium]|nr:protein translocase subunit SecD [Phycisphaeraceae bacterium]MCW5753090.1 protein translocase subunit SecD [Phycisphaeraceae bacterium]